MGCALNVRRQSARTICAAWRSRMHLSASENPCEQPHAEDAVKGGSFCGETLTAWLKLMKRGSSQLHRSIVTHA